MNLGELYDYDLILLDIDLPDMSSYIVLKNLRTQKIETPVLILTGHSAMENKVKGFGFGASGYLTKPFQKGVSCRIDRNYPTLSRSCSINNFNWAIGVGLIFKSSRS